MLFVGWKLIKKSRVLSNLVQNILRKNNRISSTQHTTFYSMNIYFLDLKSTERLKYYKIYIKLYCTNFYK